MAPPPQGQGNRFMRIAEEGFSLIDNSYYYGGGGGGYSSSAVHRRSSSSTAHQYAAQQYQTYQYQTEQQPCIYYCPRFSTTTVRVPATMEGNGIRYYQSRRVPAAARKEERVMTSDEAAQMFGGFVVVDHGPRRRSSQWGF